MKEITIPPAIVRDERGPKCGFPETYAVVDFDSVPVNVEMVGCRKCGWMKIVEQNNAATHG